MFYNQLQVKNLRASGSHISYVIMPLELYCCRESSTNSSQLKKRTQFQKSQIRRKPNPNKDLSPNEHLVTQDKTNPNEPNFPTPQTTHFTQFHARLTTTMNNQTIKIKPNFIPPAYLLTGWRIN